MEMAIAGSLSCKDGSLHSNENNQTSFKQETRKAVGHLHCPRFSPVPKSPGSSRGHLHPASKWVDGSSPCVLVASFAREEGHIYSLATTKDFLYTGSDSKNIRVWKNQMESTGLKSHSGLVKSIVTAGDKIFTGHQDGRIRVWKILNNNNANIHKRVTTLPTLRNYLKSAIKPSNYVEVKNRSVLRIKHVDCISCLSLTEDQSLLYSASWDRTFKVWRTSDFKCLESVKAHDDAINSLLAGYEGLIFTGSADGTVKVWKRELKEKSTEHLFIETLLDRDCAVTALALNSDMSVLYCGSSDGVVNFWERDHQSLSHGGVWRGHRLAVLCLATAGSLVFTGSADTRICVWRRTMAGEHIWLSVLTGHTGPVKCLAVEAEYETKSAYERQWVLYSGSLDKSVKMWRVSEQTSNLSPKKNQLYSMEIYPRSSSLNRNLSSFSLPRMGSRHES